jgi:hypothetical protein
MKTAGRENPNRYGTVLVAFRVYGTEGENNPAQWGRLDVKKKSGHRGSVFLLDSLYRTNQEFGRDRTKLHAPLSPV